MKQWRHQSLEANGSSHTSIEDKDSEIMASGYDEESVDDEDTKQPSSVCRAEKSLGILTQRFVDLLQRARGGIVDLNIVRALDFSSSAEMQWNNEKTVLAIFILVYVTSHCRPSRSFFFLK